MVGAARGDCPLDYRICCHYRLGWPLGCRRMMHVDLLVTDFTFAFHLVWVAGVTWSS